MSPLPRIGLTQRVETVPGRDERRDCLDQAWYDVVRAAGFLPLALPNRVELAAELVAGLGLRGVILTEQSKSDEAIAIFRALSEEMPELAQPHNNLGVLYAAKGRYDEARRELEMAILADPKYALAYENLGDVYARMAGHSYQRVLIGRAPTAQELEESESVESDAEEDLRADGTTG